MKFLLLFLCTLTTSLLHAQEWKLINIQDDGEEIYMRWHSESSAWIKHTNVDVYRNFGDKKSIKGEVVTLFRFDCQALKYGILVRVEYDNKGEVLRSDQTDDVLVKMQYPLPDSYGEFYLNSFCNRKE